ncbi:MAG: hypothetical protein ABI649_09305, partial [Gaiellaceae bacterium]
AVVARRGLLFVLGAAAGAALLGATRRRGRREAGQANTGRERTEQLRREIEASRARLRESIHSKGG